MFMKGNCNYHLSVNTLSTDTADVIIDEPSSRDVSDTIEIKTKPNDSYGEDKAEEKTEQNNKLVT